MVRVRNIGFAPSVNATYGESGVQTARSFVPALHGLRGLGLLRLGSQGTAVETLQQMLVDAGYQIAVDGIFGTSTQSALIAYQRAVGVPPTGVADDATMNALLGLTVTPTTPATADKPAATKSTPVWVWVAGGAGVLALGLGIFFAAREG